MSVEIPEVSVAGCSKEVLGTKGLKVPGRVITLMEMGPSSPTGKHWPKCFVHDGQGGDIR